MTVVVMPAYEPDGHMIETVSALHDAGLDVLVVDDGSGAEYGNVFAKLDGMAKVIGYEKNRGKGSALKFAFSRLKEIYPECTGFITADCDGQHRPADILKVRDELDKGANIVLTVRRMHGKIPARSKFGNNLSKFIYTLLTGHYFSDNQSGLRGFSESNLSWLTLVEGDRYDYEMNVLYYADKQLIPITTMQIETIYIDGNKSSHFSPVRDTVRIYKSLFSSAAATFSAAVVCEIVILLSSLFFPQYTYFTVPTAGALSALVNILMNKYLIFRHIKYRDGFRMIINSILRFGVFTALCMLCAAWFPGLSLFWSFNLVVVISSPFEYLIRKGIHSSQYRDINKE